MHAMVLLTTALCGCPCESLESTSELPRRPGLGAQFVEISEDLRDLEWFTAGGARVALVLPESYASEAGLKTGDVVVQVDETVVSSPSRLNEVIASKKPGDKVTLKFVRGEAVHTAKVALREMPRESGEGYDVIYTSIKNGDIRQRVIVTRPKGSGRHPAVLMLQGGMSCFPVDDPFDRPNAFIRIAKHLSRNGYVTMRIQRPGCGDSEGGPLRDVDFETELAGYASALKYLKEFDNVDANNVLLYGLSMGAIMAPLVAKEEPVKGIAVYGAPCSTWFEAMIDQRRRVTTMRGLKADEVETEMKGQIRFWYSFVIEKKKPHEIAAIDSIPQSILDLWIEDDYYVSHRRPEYHHQLADRNVTAAWSQLAIADKESATTEGASYPRVLAMWGESDFHASSKYAKWIAEIVNRTHPGNGEFQSVKSSDHFCLTFASRQDSFDTLFLKKKKLKYQFNPAILSHMLKWCDKTTQRGNS